MRSRLTWAGGFVWLFAALLAVGGGPADAGRRKAASPAPAGSRHNAAASAPAAQHRNAAAAAPAVAKPWILSVPCQPPSYVFTQSTVIHGPNNGSLGNSVSGAGDVNGDGYADVIVGASNYGTGQGPTGRAYVYLGGPSGLDATPAWTGSPGAGYTERAFYGNSVRGVGDVNKDGYADVAVGAPDYLVAPVNGVPNPGGRAFLYLGGPGGLSQAPAWTADSEGYFATDFGNTVEAAGDVNNDGYADVLVDDYNWTSATGRPGRAYLYLGGAGGLSGSPAWWDQGIDNFENFGWGLAGLGDVDGDGIGDFAVSSGSDSGGIAGAGRVTIYAGGSFTPIWTHRGAVAQERFGRAIAAAGDVNGDGLRDLLVSSRSGFNGVVSIYCGSASGISQTPCWSISGAGPYGTVLSGPGDVSGDGYDDILFNDGTAANAVLVVRGSNSFPLQSPTEFLNGSVQDAGNAFAGAGDVNGDGGLDAVTATPNSTNFPVFEGEVILWQGTKKHTEIIDPACATNVSCYGDYLKNSPSGVVLDATDTDFHRLIEAPVHRIGTVTDGVSLLMLRRISSTPVTFTLKTLDGDPLGEGWGTLSTRKGENPGSQITISPEQMSGVDCQYAFAIYKPPKDFPGTEDQVGTGLQFKVDVTDQSGLHEQLTISLRPPPFVLVHGVWSGPGVWQGPNGGLLKYLSDRHFPNCGAGCLVDYHAEPASSFDPRVDSLALSRLSEATSSTQSFMRRQEFADTQIDVIGHSEGGLVARAMVETMIFPYGPYRLKRNYGEGSFHKLITIGSPHLGTPLADFFLDSACLHTGAGGLRLVNALAKAKRPIGPAIVGFQTESTMLENLGTTDIPVHPIIGIEPVPQPANGAESKLNFMIGLIIGVSATLDGTMHEGPPGSDGEGTHDTIVPRLSQRGGSSANSIEIPGVVHADMAFHDPDVTETNSPVVWQQVASLLLQQVDGPEFAHIPAYHRPHVQDPRPLPNCASLAPPSIESGVAVLDPPPGTVVHAGDIVNLVLTVTAGEAVDGAIFFIDTGMEIVSGPSPQSLSFTVPSDRAGRLDIGAVTYGLNHENYSTETWIQIDTTEDPTSIEVFPASADLTYAGATVPLTVRGLFPSGPPVDITSSTAGTTYEVESGTPNVITVSAEGLITTVGSGSDKVIVTHGTLTKEVPVNVLITNLPPAVQAPAEVNLIAGNVEDVAIGSTDPESQHVTLAATDLPAFASFTDAGDGTGTLHLAPAPADAGTHIVYVTGVDDGAPQFGAGVEVTINVTLPPLTILSVSPNIGLNNDPTVITVGGVSFQATPQVYLGTAAQPQKYSLSAVTFDSSTQLHATVPVSLVSGLYRVTVVNPDSETTYLDDAFSVVGPLQGAPTMYVGEPIASQLTRIDLAAGTLLSPLALTAQDVPFDVAVNRTGPRGVIALLGDNQPGKVGIMTLNPPSIISKIDVPGTGLTPRAVAIDPSGNAAYVLTANPLFYPSLQELSRLDLNTGQFTNTITIGYMHDIEAADLEVSPDGQRLYATNVGDDTISVIRTSDFVEIARVAVGDTPVGIGVSPDSTRVYVTNTWASTISKIDATLATPSVIGTINVSNQGSYTGPNHVVVSPDGLNLYVAFTYVYNVSKVNISMGTIGPTLSEGGPYSKVAYVPSQAKLYAVDFDPFTGHVRRLNPTTMQAESTTSIGPYPYGMDWAAPSPPTITSVVPNQVCKLGGTVVTVTGSQFQGDVWNGVAHVQEKTRVFFGGTEATWVNFVDSTHLSVTTPAHANGWVTVEVRNPNGLNATLANGLRFTPCQVP